MAENKKRITTNKKSGRTKNGKRSSKQTIKLIGAIVLVLLIVAGIWRIASYFGSISRVKLGDEGLRHAERFKNSMVVHGIDVSNYQSDINWKKVKSSGADFVFIRAGYRKAENGELCEDESFRRNIKRAEKAGLMCGAYFYSQALDEKEAIEEAEYLLDLVKRYDVDLPLVIDYGIYEGGRLHQKISAGEMPVASIYHDIVLAFCRRVEEEGYESAVYANYNMLTNYMDASLLDDEAVIWAAQYGGACDLNCRYMYWQCADDTAVGGIEGNVDHDIWYIEPNKVYSTRAKGKDNSSSVGGCDIKLDRSSYKLKNHRVKPKVTVSFEGKELRQGKDYTLSYVKNTGSGRGLVIVRGIRKYKDWIAVPFTIE